MAKMQWLVDIIKTGKDTRCDIMQEVNKFMIENKFGNISCPTGAGKSAVVYLDIGNCFFSKRTQTAHQKACKGQN